MGDSGILTAFGVFRGLQASAELVFGTDDLAGRGWRSSARARWAAGSSGTCRRGSRGRRRRPAPRPPRGRPRPAPASGSSTSATTCSPSRLDILSPNATGRIPHPRARRGIAARLGLRGRQQPARRPGVGDLLAARGIVYAPDFMVNCGGVIQVAEELVGGDLDRARSAPARVYETTLRVLDRAAARGRHPCGGGRAGGRGPDRRVARRLTPAIGVGGALAAPARTSRYSSVIAFPPQRRKRRELSTLAGRGPG